MSNPVRILECGPYRLSAVRLIQDRFYQWQDVTLAWAIWGLYGWHVRLDRWHWVLVRDRDSAERLLTQISEAAPGSVTA